MFVVGIVALRNEQASAAPMLCALAPFVRDAYNASARSRTPLQHMQQ